MKAKEVRNLSDEEIRVELERQRRHLFDLRSQTVTEKLEDTTVIRNSKSDIARLLTEQRSRELAKEAEA